MQFSRRCFVWIGAPALLIGLVLGVAIGRSRAPFDLGQKGFEVGQSSLETSRDRPLVITAVKLKVLLQSGTAFSFVDVSDPDEFASLHIPDAKSIPLGVLWTRQGEIPRDRPIVVYCMSGQRGEIGARALVELGFTGVRYLDGGISAWQNVGLAVVK